MTTHKTKEEEADDTVINTFSGVVDGVKFTTIVKPFNPTDVTHNTREVQPTESQALPHENIIKKCWNPDCRKVATCRDGSGWEWCDDHVDQEKTGSVLHTAQEYYDVDYYTALLKERLHHQLQKAREEAVLKGERRRIIDQIRVEERQKARTEGFEEGYKQGKLEQR